MRAGGLIAGRAAMDDDAGDVRRAAKQARIAQPIDVVLENTAARAAPPPGMEDLPPAERARVLRLMVLFSRHVEPDASGRHWAFKKVISSADGPNTLQSYNCYFTGYRGVITIDELRRFQETHREHVAYIGLDLTFVSDDQEFSGAVVVNIPSASWKARRAAEAAEQAPVAAALLAETTSTSTGAAAATGPAAAAAAAELAPSAPVAHAPPVGVLPPPPSAHAPPPPPPPSDRSRKRRSWGEALRETVTAIAGLGDE